MLCGNDTNLTLIRLAFENVATKFGRPISLQLFDFSSFVLATLLSSDCRCKLYFEPTSINNETDQIQHARKTISNEVAGGFCSQTFWNAIIIRCQWKSFYINISASYRFGEKDIFSWCGNRYGWQLIFN